MPVHFSTPVRVPDRPRFSLTGHVPPRLKLTGRQATDVTVTRRWCSHHRGGARRKGAIFYKPCSHICSLVKVGCNVLLRCNDNLSLEIKIPVVSTLPPPPLSHPSRSLPFTIRVSVTPGTGHHHPFAHWPYPRHPPRKKHPVTQTLLMTMLLSWRITAVLHASFSRTWHVCMTVS